MGLARELGPHWEDGLPVDPVRVGAWLGLWAGNETRPLVSSFGSIVIGGGRVGIGTTTPSGGFLIQMTLASLASNMN